MERSKLDRNKFYRNVEDDPLLKAAMEPNKRSRFVQMQVESMEDLIALAQWMKETNYPTHRCYHKDGSYHFVGFNESNCGSHDVDFLACAHRDGYLWFEDDNTITFSYEGRKWKAKPVEEGKNGA